MAVTDPLEDSFTREVILVLPSCRYANHNTISPLLIVQRHVTTAQVSGLSSRAALHEAHYNII